jgi:hypothetical protein
MSKATTRETKQLAFRLTHAEVAWLKAEAERLKAETGFAAVSATDVVRRLIALAMRGSPTTPAPVAAPPTPAVDPRQLAIPGSVPTATKTPVSAKTATKTTKTPDQEKVRAAYAKALEAGTAKPKDLAAELGFADSSSLSHFKSGKRDLPDDKLAKLAKLLGVS